MDYAPDRVIIEPSGVGKLSDVMKAVEDAKQDADVVINSAVQQPLLMWQSARCI